MTIHYNNLQIKLVADIFNQNSQNIELKTQTKTKTIKQKLNVGGCGLSCDGGVLKTNLHRYDALHLDHSVPQGLDLLVLHVVLQLYLLRAQSHRQT